MELLGDMGHVESHFGLLGASVGARQLHGLRRTYHRLRNHFGSIRWNSLVMRLKRNLVSVHLEIVLVYVQDRCTICAERSIGSKIVLDTPDGSPR